MLKNWHKTELGSNWWSAMSTKKESLCCTRPENNQNWPQYRLCLSLRSLAFFSKKAFGKVRGLSPFGTQLRCTFIMDQCQNKWLKKWQMSRSRVHPPAIFGLSVGRIILISAFLSSLKAIQLWPKCAIATTSSSVHSNNQYMTWKHVL